MKNFMNAFVALCLMLFTLACGSAQNSKDKTIEFKVTGNCNMCKKTIETSLKGNPGITLAEWNKESKMIKVIFEPEKISEDQIHQNIADVGYDTEKKKASDKIYSSLPGCCQYTRTLHN